MVLLIFGIPLSRRCSPLTSWPVLFRNSKLAQYLGVAAWADPIATDPTANPTASITSSNTPLKWFCLIDSSIGNSLVLWEHGGWSKYALAVYAVNIDRYAGRRGLLRAGDRRCINGIDSQVHWA